MTTYLVRHASAGARDDADPHDDRRPLDEVGLLQAAKLAAWLQHEPIQRILASPFLRCQQSVTPLAAATGLRVECADALAESTPVEEAWQLIEDLAAGTAVMCSHGDVIPDLIRRAQGRGMLVPGKSGCAKGSVWTLRHWDGTVFATGVYTPIPGS